MAGALKPHLPCNNFCPGINLRSSSYFQNLPRTLFLCGLLPLHQHSPNYRDMKKTTLSTILLGFSLGSQAQVSEAMPLPEVLTMPCAMNVLNGKMLFVASSPVHGKELWSTDGTQEGTFLLKEINNDYNVNALNAFTYNNSLDAQGYFGILGDQMFFPASSTFSGNQNLWVTNGTTEGTYKCSIPGNEILKARWFKEFNGRLYFTAQTVANGWEIWSTDGTVAGTAMLKDINPDQGNGFQMNLDPNFFVFENRLWFKANDGTHGIELWSTDGTTAGTSLFTDLNTGYANDPSNFDAFRVGTYFNVSPLIVAGDHFYFSAFDGSSESGGLDFLFLSDGTPAGTIAPDAAPTMSGSIPKYYKPTGMTKFGDALYFFAFTGAYNGGTQSGLWKLDLATQDITFVKGVTGYGDNGLSDNTPRGSMREFNGKLYFAGDDGNDYRLWSTDGTADGTQEIFHTSNNVDSFDTTYFFRSLPYNDKLYFVAGSTFSENVYSTDGTTAGTVALFPETMAFGPQQFMRYGFSVSTDSSDGMVQAESDTPEAFYFATTHNIGAGYQLWRLREESLLVEHPLAIADVKVFPNPTQGVLNVQFQQAVNNGVMTLANMLGQEIRKQNGLQGTYQQFDFSGLAKGMYLLRIEDGAGNFTKKILVQ